MKYGIKHSNGNLIALSRFDIEAEADLPVDFIEITAEDYDDFLKVLEKNPHVIYDEASNTLTADDSAQSEDEALQLQEKKREELRRLSIELDLMKRLEEDTTGVQRDFDDLKLEYQTP